MCLLPSPTIKNFDILESPIRTTLERKNLVFKTYFKLFNYFFQETKPLPPAFFTGARETGNPIPHPIGAKLPANSPLCRYKTPTTQTGKSIRLLSESLVRTLTGFLFRKLEAGQRRLGNRIAVTQRNQTPSTLHSTPPHP